MPSQSSARSAGSRWRAAAIGLVLRRAPEWIRRGSYERALGWGERMGEAWWRVARRRRREAEQAVARSIADLDREAARRVVREMFRHLGTNAAESLWLTPERLGDFIRERVRIEGLEHVERARAQGAGGLILTAHLGNFDVLCCAAPALGFPLATVSKRMRDPTVDGWIRERWRAYGVEVLPPHNSIRDCIRAIRAGWFLGFMLDQNMTRDEGVFVEFFGRPACTTPGLAVLAAYTGSPVIPVFVRREPDGRHLIQVLPPRDPPAGRQAEALRAATQEYTRVIEEQVRKCPEQWIWLHRRWRTRPPESDHGAA